MRVLVACQHYWPEPFNTSDVCEGLVKRGHEVSVITALPNVGMPGDDVPSEWRDPSLRIQERNGVEVLRVGLHPRRSGAKDRVLNYLTFWRNANKLAKSLPPGYDVTLGYQFSPVMQVDPALIYARRNRIGSLLYCFDLWPASLSAGGFSESSLPFRWMRAVSKRIYSQADRIAVTSPLFDDYFRDELGLDLPASLYLPQYADDVFFSESDTGVCDKPEGYDSAKLNITFAGNVGQAQSVITIVEAAALLREDPTVVLHIVGSGSKLGECESRARDLDLSNLVFHGRRPLGDMPAYYSASDAMLITFEASPMAFYTLPRKMTTYLAAGKPVLAALEGEAERVIREAGCGLACGTADAEGLADAIRTFAAMPKSDRNAMGKNARIYYDRHFSEDLFFDALEAELENLVEKGGM